MDNIETDILDSIVKLVRLHMISECGDGDTVVCFKYRKNMLLKVRDALVEEFKWHIHSLEDDENGCLLTDRCNENVILTTKEEVASKQPPWITLELKV